MWKKARCICLMSGSTQLTNWRRHSFLTAAPSIRTSSLKNVNTLDAEHVAWENGRRSLSGTQVWPGKLRRVAPDLDRPRHDHLQGLPGVLQQPGCRPLVTAVTRIQEFYKENRLDIFRVAITAPGMAHKTVKTGICGGPSIIFKQHHKVGETHLRSNPSQGVGVSPDTMPTHCICGRSANLC